mmetsp:Transcript_41871/g.110428  ORF Transcript_41871/g.110428 Transcript_41871/m.110428 type:complete len:337 (+) Transcript_41871:449-1459(+)
MYDLRLLLPEVLGAARLLLEMALDRGPDAAHLQEEGVVAECRVQLVVAHVLVAIRTECVGDLLLLPDRKQHVVLDADHQSRLHRRGQPRLQARLSVRSRQFHGEAVHGLGDPQHRVRIIVVHPLLPLVGQVPLNLELVLQALVRLLPRAGEAVLPEAVLPLLARPVGDRPELTGKAQAVGGQVPVVVVAVVPVGVLHDGGALSVAESHAAGEALRARGNRHELTHALGEAGRGADALHASQGGPHAGVEAIDAQVVQKPELGRNLVVDLEAREAAAVAPAVPRVDRGGAGGAVAAAEVVGANHEKDPRVQRLARADEVLPPALRGIPGVRASVGGG